jgi:hypothetical protein
MSQSPSAEATEAATTKSNKKEDVSPDTNGGSPGFFSRGNYSPHM